MIGFSLRGPVGADPARLALNVALTTAARGLLGATIVFVDRQQVCRFHNRAAALKPYGCRFTVDGFGSVKGSFGLLRDNVFSFIKVDGVIVQDMLRDPAQLTRLRAIGAHYVQGFGVERPQPMVRVCA